MGISKLGYGNYWTEPMPQKEIDLLESCGHINTINEFLNFLEMNYINQTAISWTKNEKFFNKTFQELLMDIKASRNFLIKKQIKKGDVIGIQMPNEYLFIVILLAIISIGAIANVFPTQISSEVLEKIYQQYQIKLLICSNKEDQKTSSFNTVTANEIYDNQLLPFVDTIAQNDLAVLYFTGGTTSQPKVVKLTHKNLMRGMTNGAYGFSKIMHLKYLTVIPFYHVFGLVRSALTPLYTGSENYLGNFSDVLKELTIVDPDIICTVPAMLEMICFFAKKDINILGKKHKTVVVGGAEINPILLKEANKLGIYACSGYGLTETTNLVSGSRFEAENASTAGHLFDFQEIKIVNHELWIKGENVSPGYYLDTENTKKSFEDGWFKTGDLVEYKNNNLYIIGRVKNLIVLPNGEKISPEEIESKFNQTSLIKDSMLYFQNNQIILEVVPNKVSTLSNEQLLKEIQNVYQTINNQLPTFMTINKLIIREDDFKRTTTMKKIRST